MEKCQVDCLHFSERYQFFPLSLPFDHVHLLKKRRIQSLVEIKNGIVKKYIGNDTSVIIPEGVLKIGDRAFLNCTSLTNIILPEGVKKIGDYAFFGCANLKNIILPKSLKIIEGNAFTNCINLTSITIPDDVGYIALGAFYHCIKLKITFQGFTFLADTERSINIFDIVDLIRKKEFEKMPSRIAYSVIWNLFYHDPQDETALAYIKKRLTKMCKFLIDQNELPIIQKILDSSHLLTKKNIDPLIQYAIDHKQIEIQILLTDYKMQKNWYDDTESQIQKKFNL